MRNLDYLGLEGQIDLLSLLMSMDAPKKKAWKRKKVPESSGVIEQTEQTEKAVPDEDYLKKGERLMSLAREKYKLSEKIYSKFEEKFFQVKLPENGTLWSIVDILAKKVIRPILRAEETFTPDGEVMSFFKKYIDYPISISRDVPQNIAPARCLRYRGKKSSDIIALYIEDEKRSMIVYGYRADTHPSSITDCLMRSTRENVADIAVVLAWLMVFGIYNKTISDEEQMEAVKAVTDERLKRLVGREWPIDPLLHGLYRDTFGSQWWSYRENLPATIEEFNGEYEKNPVGFVVPFYEYYRPENIFPLVGRIFHSGILEAEVADSPILQSQNENILRAAGVVSPTPVKWIVGRNFETAVKEFHFMESVEKGLAKEDYLRYLSPYGREDTNTTAGVYEFFMSPRSCEHVPDDILGELIEPVVKLSFETEQNRIRTAGYYREINREHAKSYQTKRGIPQYILEEMKSSAFNDYFGYVEIDEECDVEKVRVIAEQFNLFKAQYLATFDFSSVSLRFRKLGNHKASGLYYPHINCLCVDFRSPSSFIHEVGHCIDHLLGDRGDLSQKGDFYGVFHRYKELLYIRMWDNAGGCKERLTGNSKYNLGYYLTPTEVFARCWEIYISRVLGLDFTLCKPDKEDEFAYPKDERLEEYIKTYFDRLSEERINKKPPTTGMLDEAA